MKQSVKTNMLGFVCVAVFMIIVRTTTLKMCVCVDVCVRAALCLEIKNESLCVFFSFFFFCPKWPFIFFKHPSNAFRVICYMLISLAMLKSNDKY